MTPEEHMDLTMQRTKRVKKAMGRFKTDSVVVLMAATDLRRPIVEDALRRLRCNCPVHNPSRDILRRV